MKKSGGARKVGNQKTKCDRYKGEERFEKNKARRKKNRIRKRLNWLKNLLKRKVITEEQYQEKVKKVK